MKSLLTLGAGAIVAVTYFGADADDALRAAKRTDIRFAGPTSSQPLALSADGNLLAVANPDNNSVSFFDLTNDRNWKLGEVKVQEEPSGVALSPAGDEAYVANTVSGTVTVIKLDAGYESKSKAFAKILRHIPVGTEPYAVVLSPSGRRLFVANARSNTLSIINTRNLKVIKTLSNVGLEPRGLAVTNDGDEDDDDETLYVSQFLSLPVVNRIDGEDDSKAGLVTVVSLREEKVTGTIAIKPIADTGFKATGDAIARVAPPATVTEADFKFTTGAYPNQLNNIAIKGNFAYLPNTGASPNGPVRFDVNTQSLLSVVNRQTNLDAGRTINMHAAVRDQTATPKLFVTLPWAMAFKNRADEGYVISASSNVVIKVKIDPTTGAPTVQRDPQETTRVLQVKVGKNPRGIVVNGGDTRAYVMNYVSRDVTVIDVGRARETVLATFKSAALPTAGTLDDKIHVGKELYNTSVGEFDPAAAGGAAITGRMSNNGWGSCAACHPFGLADNVVWIFPAGPRRTISQHADFDPGDPARNAMRPLNWTANRDEQEDFELNIRAVSGGLGLIVQADGSAQETAVTDFTPLANGGRRQLKVRGVNAWDAIKAYEQFGIRSPISPIDKDDPDVINGEKYFRTAKCQTCHGGTHWTTARVSANVPPQASQVVNAQLLAELKKVGTFDSALKNEVRQNALAPLGADGFVPPSLLSLHAFPQTFLHGGAANTLEAVLNSVPHRSAGTTGSDTLTDATQRLHLIKFLLSIDRDTPPIEVQ